MRMSSGGRPADSRLGLRTSSADLISVPVVNFIQNRRQMRRDPRAVLTAVYRNAEKLGDFRRARFSVEAGEYAYVEAPVSAKEYPARKPEHEDRARQSHRQGRGAEAIAQRQIRLFSPSAPGEGDLPRKGRAIGKARGRRPAFMAWLAKPPSREVVREGRIEEEWAANSELDGCLDAARGKVPLNARCAAARAPSRLRGLA